MAVVSREVAQEEIERWLEYKKVNERKREAYTESIATLVDAVCDGSISVDEKYNLVQSLKFPVGEEATVSKLEYRPRLRVSTVHQHLQGVKTTDADGRILAYMAALTGKPKAIVSAMDTEDYSVGQAIAIFFL